MSSEAPQQQPQLEEEKRTASTAEPQVDASMADDDDMAMPALEAETHNGTASDAATSHQPPAAAASLFSYTAPPEGWFLDHSYNKLRQLSAARKAEESSRAEQMERLVHHQSSNKRKAPAAVAAHSAKPAAEARNHLSRAQKSQRAANKQSMADALEYARQQQKEKQAERAAGGASGKQLTASAPASKARGSQSTAHARISSRGSTDASSLPTWLAVEEIALPSFIARGASLDLVVNEKQLRGWVEEAVSAWQRVADERRRLHGPRQRKFAAVGANGGKAASTPKAKPQQPPTRPAPQERKPSIVLPPPIVEDTLLPSYTSSPPLPTSSALFAACPAGSVTDVVRAFDLMSTYRDVLYLGAAREMSLPMFLQAVLTEPSSAENHLLNSVMAALMRAVLRTAPATTSTATAATLQQNNGKPFAFQRAVANDTLQLAAEEEEVSKGAVVNALTWQAHLQAWLVDDSLRWIHRKKWREHRILSAFLSIDTFYQLALPQRLYLLQLLARIAVRSPYMRFYFATAIDTIAATRKQIQAARNAQIHAQRDVEMYSGEVAQCVVELVDAVCAKKKRERESGHTAHSLLKHEKAWLRVESERQGKEWDAKVEECVEWWKLRTVSIGCDRYWNRYWLYGGRTDVLVIYHSDEYVKVLSDRERQEEEEQQRKMAARREAEEEEEAKVGKEERDEQQRMEVDGDEKGAADERSGQAAATPRAAPPRYSAVTDKEGLSKLLTWLHPRGIREKALREALDKVKWTWKESNETKAEAVEQLPTGVKEETKLKDEVAVRPEPPSTAQPAQSSAAGYTASPGPFTTAGQPSPPAEERYGVAFRLPSPPVARLWSLRASNPAALLSPDYAAMLDLNKYSLRATQVLASEPDDLNGYQRCPVCQGNSTTQQAHSQRSLPKPHTVMQRNTVLSRHSLNLALLVRPDQYAPSTDQHCSACHANVERQADKEGAGMLEHVAACRGDEVRKPRVNSMFHVEEQDRERDEVTVDLDVSIVPTKRLRKKTDESSESDSGDDEDEEDEEEREAERERLEREKEQDEADDGKPMDDGKEEEKKEDASLSQDGSLPLPSANASAASPSPSPTQLSKSKLVTQHRLSPRPTSINNFSPFLLVLKALVFDIEACIPIEAVRSRNAAGRAAWVDGLKLAGSMRAIGQGLSELGRNLRAGWLKSWFDVEGWLQRLRAVQSESAFAACLFEFDRAFLYNEEEQTEEGKRQAALEESATAEAGAAEAGSDSEAELDKEGCRICKATDDPETMLLCDGCDLEYHCRCVGLRSIPKGKWFCPNCRKTAGGKAAASSNKKDKSGKSGSSKSKGGSKASGGSKKGKAAAPALVYTYVEPELAADYGICKKCHINEGDPLLCDRCDDAYHLHCAQPPLDTVPEGDWFCGPCLEEVKEEEEAKRRKKAEKEAADGEEEFELEGAEAAEADEQEAEAEQLADEEEEEEEADEDVDMAEEEEEEEEEEEKIAPKPRKRLIQRAKKDSDTENEEEEELNATADAQTDDDEEEAEFAPGGSGSSGSPPIKKQKKAGQPVDFDDAASASASPSPVPASEEELSSSGASDDCCSVCFFTHSPADNPIVYCDGCNQTVHVRCQGMDAPPPERDEWFCDRCAVGLKPDTERYPCAICKKHLSAGCMRLVESGKRKGEWVHLSCAIFYPAVQFGDVQHRRGIKGVENVTSSGQQGKDACLCCSQTSGAMVKCEVQGCSQHMHVPCALASTVCVMLWDAQSGRAVKRCPTHNKSPPIQSASAAKASVMQARR